MKGIQATSQENHLGRNEKRNVIDISNKIYEWYIAIKNDNNFSIFKISIRNRINIVSNNSV